MRPRGFRSWSLVAASMSVLGTPAVASGSGNEEHHHHHHHHHAATKQALEKPLIHARYAPYPYAEGAAGHVLRVPASEEPPGRLFAGQIAAEGAYLGSRLWRTDLRVRFTFSRVGLDSNHSFHFRDPREDGLHLGSTNFLFAPVLRPRVALWTGVGVNYMIGDPLPGHGGREVSAGYNLTSSVEVFPFSPFVLSGRVDAGMIHETRVLAARSTVGAVLGNGFEIYGGYEYRRLGKVALHGPMAGVRVWF